MNLKNLRAFIVAAIGCVQLTASATSYTWNNGAANSDWDTTSLNWTGSAWVNGTANSAIFGATGAGTVTLTTAITANAITFNAAGYTITGGTLTVGGTTPTITANSSATISSILAGTGGLTTAGAGTLTLSGANTYTGTTTVSAGTLALGNTTFSSTSPLSISSSGTAASSGTLKMNANTSATTVGVTGAGTFSLTSTTNSASFPDIFFDANDVAGNSTANDGCRIATPVTLGSLQRYVWGMTDHNGVGKYGLTAADCQFAGTISGAGGLTFIAQDNYTGSSPMETPFCLNASNSFTGPVVIQRGSVYLGNTNALTQTNVLTLNSSGTNNARFFLYGNNVTVANLSSSSGGTNLIANGNLATSAQIALSNATLTVVQTVSNTFSGSLVDMFSEYPGSGSFTQGPLGLTKQGAATLTLVGTNTYSGPTTITAGTLQIDNLLGGGTYAALITNNGTLAFNSTNNQTLSGSISGTGGIQQNGAGTTLTLLGTNNTYSGGTTLTAGTISITNASAVGTGPVTVTLTASGTLTVANTSAVSLTNNIVLGSPGIAETLNIVKNSSGQTTGTQLNLAGTISGGDGTTELFLNSNTGGDTTTTYLFSGTNSFLASEINLNRGSIIVANAASMGNAANLLYLDGNNNKTLGDLRFAASMTLANPVDLVSGGSTTINTDTNNVVLTGALSGATFVKLGSGSLALNGGNSYTGNTTINGGDLVFGAAGTMPSGSLITVAGNATMDVSALASAILGGSQTLQGSGAGPSTVLGAFQDSTGSTIIPGGTTNVGTLAFGGNLTLAGSDTLNFDLGKTPTSAGGTNNDLITVAGNLTINPGTTVNINPIQVALAGGTYKLISYTGTLTDNSGGIATAWTVGSYTPSGRITGVAISDSTPGEIDLIVTGNPANLVWQGDGVANAWDVQTTENWLNGVSPDYFYQFDNVLFTDSSTNTSVDIQAAVTPSLVVVSNNVKNYTFINDQGINGGGSLTKSGTGTLNLLNSNPYTGITTINGGTLALGDGVSNDGALTASPIIDNATLEFNVASSQTAATAISGSGVVVQTGNINGTLTLNAVNSWTGGLNIQSGTAKPGVNYGLPGAESVNIAPGGAYDFNGILNGSTTTRADSFTIAGAGPDSSSGAMVNSGAGINFSSSVSNLTLSANATVGGSGRWDIGNVTNSTVNGNGFVLTKAGANNMAFAPQILTNVASLQITSGNLFYQSYSQTNPWTANITNYVASGATLGIYGSQTINVPIIADGGTIDNQGSGTPVWSGSVSVTANSAIFSTYDSQIFSGSVYGPGGLTIQGGTYSVTLSGANTYAGGTTINQGTLVAANSNALGTGNVTINTGSLYFNFPTGSTNVITNSIALPAAATEEFTIQAPTNFTTVRLTGVISGGTAGLEYNLVDSGVSSDHYNTLILDNPNNTFAGNIEMNRGTLGFTSDAALGSSSNPIFLDTWNLNGALRFDANNITVNSGRSITLVYSSTTAYPAPINVQDYTGTIAGVMSGPGNLVKQGVGTLILTAANTYTGPTTVSAGELEVNGSLASVGAVTVNTNGILGGNGVVSGATTIQAGGTLQPGLGGTDTSTLTISTNLTLAGNALFVINRSNTQNAAQVAGLHTLNYGGALTVVNAGPAVQLGDTYTLFSAAIYTNNFTVTNLPNISPLAWNWSPASGTLSVVNGVNQTPTNIVAVASAGTLTLSWPADHTGWRLLVQTNNLATGISANTNDWATVAGSAATNQVFLPINPAQPAEFYRLVYP